MNFVLFAQHHLEPKLRNQIIFFLLVSVLVGLTCTPYMAIATFSYALMSLGVLNRKNQNIHSKMMLSAVAADLLLVLTLELQRSAINTAVSFKLGPWQQAHIFCSTTALLLYFPLLFLGYLFYIKKSGSASQRKLHKHLGIVAYLFRTLSFILMFSMLER